MSEAHPAVDKAGADAMTPHRDSKSLAAFVHRAAGGWERHSGTTAYPYPRSPMG